jgi:hypothetical protein
MQQNTVNLNHVVSPHSSSQCDLQKDENTMNQNKKWVKTKSG